MFFFRKQKFFLDLTEPTAGEQEAKAAKGAITPAILAPPAAAPAKGKKEKAPAKAVATPAFATLAFTPVAAAAPAATAAVTPAAAAAPMAPGAASAVAPGAAPAEAGPLRTTAEDIAAQLAAEAASRPAPTLSTFAPDCLVPGAATPRRRRKAGANLGAFKEIAKGMMKS